MALLQIKFDPAFASNRISCPTMYSVTGQVNPKITAQCTGEDPPDCRFSEGRPVNPHTAVGVFAVANTNAFAVEDPGGHVRINCKPTLADVLEEGIRRLEENNTCKLWQLPGGRVFHDCASIRYLEVPFGVAFRVLEYHVIALPVRLKLLKLLGSSAGNC